MKAGLHFTYSEEHEINGYHENKKSRSFLEQTKNVARHLESEKARSNYDIGVMTKVLKFIIRTNLNKIWVKLKQNKIDEWKLI